MKITFKLTLLFFLLFSNKLIAQNTLNINNLEAPKTFDNVFVKRVAGDSLSTQFIIWIKDTVPTHHHVWHSESIYILEGSATMYINDSLIDINKGDLIFMPKQNNHAVKVTSKTPLKVLSIQAPGFYGKDRVYFKKD